ncbi:MAG: hypothetical protein RMK84_11700 [Oscillochloridaceae bacterium]|nr:hypothetical protein [Chloroflexaceae bacterium]MDW8390780.1 hypothetical protein [Oscillochloridaceae bacterium]
MEAETLRQLRGGVELAADAVDAATGAIAEAHKAIARQVYAPFGYLGPLGAPARIVEQIQMTITIQVYRSIQLTSRLVARGAVTLLECQTKGD